MKRLHKLLLSCAAVLALHFSAGAQTSQKTMFKAEHIGSSQLPPEVAAAFKAKYPSMNLKDIVKLPLNTYKKNWQVDDLQYPTGNEQFYKLFLTGKDMNLEALYDAKGNLVRANEVASNVVLPTKISTYIVTNYKGYEIKKDQVKRLIEPSVTTASYEVTISKGSTSKRVLFDKDGNFMKEKA